MIELSAEIIAIINMEHNINEDHPMFIIFELLRPNKNPSKYTLIHDNTIAADTTAIKSGTVSRFKSITSVIFTFADLINTFKPTVIIGYGLKRNGFKLMQHLLGPNEPAFREKKQLALHQSNTQFGNELWYVPMNNHKCRVIDVFSLLQEKQLSMRSYKLNNVLLQLQLSNIVQLYTYLSTV